MPSVAFYRSFSRGWPMPLGMWFIMGLAAFVENAAWGVVVPRDLRLPTQGAELSPEPNEKVFPQPPTVAKQVRFWEKVFYKYPTTTVIVHELDDLDRVVDLIDAKAMLRDGGQDGVSETPIPRKQRDELVQKYLKRYNLALERFKKFGQDAVQFGAIEERLFNVYRKDNATLMRLYTGAVKLRAQAGLADEFIQAAATAQNYLPYMEKVFRSYGVPTRLTRLPFVESMFNMRARSKVGASGIWQFMPDTARHFIYVTSLVDERNDPFKATRAAAGLLSGNYRDLSSWPLAITAYNHGKAGMAKAAKQVGSRDIGAIIERFTSPSFGFASRNFYAEFLAASNTYDRLLKEGRIKSASILPETEAIVLIDETSIADLLAHTPVTRNILEQHNPCLLEPAYTSNRHKKLPPYYEIRVPRDIAGAMKAALQNLKVKRYAKG